MAKSTTEITYSKETLTTQTSIANVLNKINMSVVNPDGKSVASVEFDRLPVDPKSNHPRGFSGFIKTITVKNRFKYVPDFRLDWCDRNNHFRVYILIASPKQDKVNTGFNVCTISNKKEATQFFNMYSYIFATRSNNKAREETFQSLKKIIEPVDKIKKPSNASSI